MTFPAYPAYRDSGVEWIGRLPLGWTAIPLKRDLLFLTSGSRGWADHYADEGALFLRIGNLPRGGLELDLADIQRVAVPAGAEGERTRVQAGDVLFSITAFMGSVAVVPDNLECAYVSQHVALARLRGELLLPRWVGYATLSAAGKAYLDAQCYGGTKIQLSLDDVANLPVAVPPPEEQRALVAFLDRETGKIDALVAEQERLIALLKEKRQAVISQAVTKGLDPNAPMKDSGVEWLGEVPAHWEVRKLVTGLREPPCYGVLVPDFDEAGVPMLRINDIDAGVADRASLTTISPSLSAQYARTIVESGDVALSVVGTIGEAIQIGATLTGANLSRALARLQPKDSLFADFLCLIFQSRAFERFVDLTCVGTAQRVLNMSALSAFRVAFPPPAEQSTIAAHLQDQTQRLDLLTGEAERTITLLKERRAALISAAVTGKIDVRGLVPEVQEAA